MTRILVIEDEEALRENLAELLDAEGYTVHTAAEGKSGVAAALADPPDLVLCDVTMPVMDGLEVLDTLRDFPATAHVPFILISARAERADVRAGMAAGADDYVTKPFSREELLGTIRARLARRGRGREPGRPADLPPELVLRAPGSLAAWDRARRAAATDISVLLLGETGVGKDVFAHAIHRASPRAARPFVPLHCAALAPSLLESELFGHDRGAFTGAAASRPGLFESAEGGTVFLDEIGEVPLEVQVKLLRVLEHRRVTPVGGRSARAVDVRFVAATNRGLERAVEAGGFRRDLYYRLAGVSVEIPPLRERRAEVLPLAERLLETLCRRSGRSPVPRFDPDAEQALTEWHWPGNVRELRNVVEQAAALQDGALLGRDALPPYLAGPTGGPAATLRAELRDVERQRIVDTLEQHGGNQTQAARALGLSRRTLLNRLDEYGLPRPRRRD